MALYMVAIVALCVFSTKTAAQDPPTVTVKQGDLVGTTETFQESQFIRVNKTIDVFKGIPFAEPPVGPLRFKPPVAKQPWVGTYNATYFRDACMQDPLYAGGVPVSEDCLHLNIYAPKPALPEGAAVMVWIHGGGFSLGTSRDPLYSGQALVASNDVIVVSINYRLNAFGFLTTGDEVLPGNIGLMDQVLALEWIKENIEAFGGDKDRVTIFGQSAESASVSFLVLSQLSAGLFQRAIMQSGTAFSPWGYYNDKEKLRKQAFEIGGKLGCGASESTALVNCLREQNATDLIRALDIYNHRFLPLVDGTFLVDTPAALYATGRYNHVDILLGSNKDEGTLTVFSNPRYADYYNSPTPPTLSRQDFDELIAEDIFLDSSELIRDAIDMQYIDWSQADFSDHDYFRSYVDYGTDFGYTSVADRVARFHFHGNDNVFLYQMTHVPSVSVLSLLGGPGWLGCAHGEDLSFVFGLPFLPDTAPLYAPFTDDERALAVEFMKFWTNFAKVGRPGVTEPSSGRDFWPMFTVPELEYKELNLNMTTSRALRSQQAHFWNTHIAQLQTMLADMDEAQREWREEFYTWKYTDMADWRSAFSAYKST